jgi:hypothetical protein
MNSNDASTYIDNLTLIKSGTCTDTGFDTIRNRFKVEPARHIGGDYVINDERTSSSAVSLIIRNTSGHGFTYGRIQFY